MPAWFVFLWIGGMMVIVLILSVVIDKATKEKE